MKNRLWKLLAAGVGAATLMMGAVGVQAEEAATEAVSEEATEAAAEDTTEAAEEEAEDEENYETGDASKDNPRNQDEIGEKELLVVSFGTSYNDNRVATIGAIENAMEEAFPDYSVRRGFTAQIIIDHVKNRDGEVIDNFGEALNRAIDNGVKTLVVQPTHLMNGLEYNDVIDELAQYAEEFEQVVVGDPLLTTDEDYDTVISAITEDTKAQDDGETAIVFMGHGTEAESNQIYATMQEKLTAAGYANYFVGTVEATPSLDDVLAAVQAGEYKKVVLQPLMIVAGDHANNDMAGDEEGAWKKTFEDAGYEVTCNLKGLGEMPAIQELLVAHAQKAIDSLAE
ncbi:cobalt chelatase (CbiK) [Marvinbryantia formatexigens DSM 14469]|uniref:Cobalt chelatase (CbiK) n=1 Tax=Marvinbryantia formatexigens DSM 14469 TaxID=478749 RepID=C6L916_9FIRM|nr:sirohydrochlorin cobaltochelatase [Marvinbryantia formatexigens]EET62754.1 cobalt chelatase (CbiK) [Marvinbryantia formatexigens DSM 14469]UWO23118.1 sirohydrochlorin cobaltochelatase [Marvinbryantia formatexigens DSM 14469]SDG00074.1 sirohydrochlorin cobaltochelatase [Marvinbryantia formatexigens]